MKKKAQRKNYCPESLSFKINSSHEISKSKVHDYKFYSSMKMEQKICKQQANSGTVSATCKEKKNCFVNRLLWKTCFFEKLPPGKNLPVNVRTNFPPLQFCLRIAIPFRGKVTL